MRGTLLVAFELAGRDLTASGDEEALPRRLDEHRALSADKLVVAVFVERGRGERRVAAMAASFPRFNWQPSDDDWGEHHGPQRVRVVLELI